MTRVYATPWQAAADAQALHKPAEPALLPLWHHLQAVLAEPQASSDHLLLCADALRTQSEAARALSPTYADALHRWANTLTDLAPSRANPLEDA